METNHKYLDDYENLFEVVDANKLHTLLTFDENDEGIDVFNMTSLQNFMLLGQNDNTENYTEEDNKLHRLSLAYERLHSMPKMLLQEVAPSIMILDLSHNEFDNLDFLKEFPNLTTLICDHNRITSNTIFPFLPKLELLWLNHCKIISFYGWLKNLQQSCPNLKYLSLMGNPVTPSFLNGGNFYEYLQYRLFVISLFPKLLHLDDRAVTEDQRNEALRLYHRPLIERIVKRTQSNLPEYLKSLSLLPNLQNLNDIVERNVII